HGVRLHLLRAVETGDGPRPRGALADLSFCRPLRDPLRRAGVAVTRCWADPDLSVTRPDFCSACKNAALIKSKAPCLRQIIYGRNWLRTNRAGVDQLIKC